MQRLVPSLNASGGTFILKSHLPVAHSSRGYMQRTFVLIKERIQLGCRCWRLGRCRRAVVRVDRAVELLVLLEELARVLRTSDVVHEWYETGVGVEAT